MVKKLFKHEILAYARVMSLVYIILLTIAVVGRVIQFFQSDSVVYTIISGIANITYTVCLFSALSFGFVFGIIRFYKNLFTAEGYLSFTLPVTSAQHIVTKSVTALGFSVITVLVILLSGCVITAGDFLVEIMKALGYIFQKLHELASFHIPLFVLEFVLLMLVSSFSNLLLYYMFITIGQLFKKNRILASVGTYFAYYLLTQVVFTIVLIVFSVWVPERLLEQIGEFVTLHPYASIHIALCGLTVLVGVFAIIYFVVTRTIINRKLNLE